MALTYQQAVEQTIIGAEQFHEIINGSATSEIVVEDGSKIPSVRKALIDNFYYKDPIDWQQGQSELVFNQIRKFTDGTWWIAPTSTATNPVVMGVTPYGDPLWKVFSWDRVIDSQKANRKLIERSWDEAGYNVVAGSFQEGATLNTTTDIIINYGTDFGVYSWGGTLPKVVPANSTVTGTGGVSPATWISKVNDSLRNQIITGDLLTSEMSKFQQEGVGSSVITSQDKLREWVSVEDKGGVGDGITDNSTAFANAAIIAKCVKVGNGVFFSSVPPTTALFSDRGGSVKLGTQIYKLSIVPQVISPYEQTEPDGVVVRLSNMAVGQDCAPDMANGTNSYANTLMGTSAGKGINDNVTRLSAYGGYICKELILGYSIDAFGTNACEWMGYGDRITLVGANAGKNLGNADPVGRHEYFKPDAPNPNGWDTRWPAWRTFAGAANAPAQVMTAGDYETKASHIVGVGRNSFGFSITATDSVGLGYDSCTSLLYGQDCVGVGDRVMQWTIKGDFSTWIGSKAARSLMDSSQDTGVGYLAGANYVHSSRNVAIGYQALAGLACGLTDTPASNVAIGRISMANAVGNITSNVGVGEGTLLAVQSNENTAIGVSALTRLSDPAKGRNTAIGRNALITMQDTTNATSIQNCVGLGYSTRVSGDNQVQLGDSTTTTYVYGTVQNRSDADDKTDVRDTVLGIDFIMGLRPVDGRWDMRDDYVEEYPVQVGINDEAEPVFETRFRQLQKDGSKARSRFHHWFIAQEVKELCDKLGVDFGGYQDHSVNGGCDVKTLGYDEFIPPTVKAVQQCWERLDEQSKEIALCLETVKEQAVVIKALKARIDSLEV